MTTVRCAVASVVAAALMALASPPAAEAFTIGGKPCKLIEVPTAAPIGAGACPGVRPGALVETPKGFCTLNFLFTGSDGRRYMGTAGHCILGESPLGGEDAGEQKWAPGSGPVARDADGNRIGEFAYAVLQDPRDFALIRLDPDPGVAANPQVCHFGGPTGVNSDRTSNPVLIHHYGQGLVLGDVLPARTALAPGTPSPDELSALGAVISGDSGGPATSADGRALGVVVAVGLGLAPGEASVLRGPVFVTRIAPQAAQAGRVLGTDLTLKTAPQL